LVLVVFNLFLASYWVAITFEINKNIMKVAEKASKRIYDGVGNICHQLSTS
jgi:hypothetical protein